ncbi:hypothetical protein [Streptomyces sp. NPDC059063]|uniref:hypothetical protein n=1 Tax=unclassified Streptomyces TaxID=2593676 RepID=UPI00369C2F8F
MRTESRKRKPDMGLAMNSFIALITYRLSRMWGAVLIILEPVKEAFLSGGGPRSTEARRGGGVLPLTRKEASQ